MISSANEGTNPFAKIRVRVLALWGLAYLAGCAALVWGFDFDLQENPAVESALYNGAYLWPMLWVLWQRRTHQLRIGRLIGPSPRFKGCVISIVWAFPVLLFSMGASWFLIYGLSFVAPGVAEWVLEPIVEADTFPYPLISTLTTLLLAPVVEELLFRGVIFHRWVEKWGVVKAAWISAIVFALPHTDWFGGLIFGLAATALYVRFGSLVLAILLHVVNNSIAMGLFLTSPAWLNPLSIEDLRRYVWVGGTCLVLSLPWIVWFLRKQRPRSDWRLPYFSEPIRAVGQIPATE